MPFTVTDFHDLIRLLEEHADWRTELRRVLFSQDLLDLPRTVQVTDVERATERAAVLRRAGLTALPVAAGQEWPSDVQAMARRDGVVIVQDGMVDRANWEAARASL